MSPFKLAIVGGGPSAFYVASRILATLGATNSSQKDLFRIHIYDRLWSPYGLVRYGVAPDHPEVKNCTHKFDTVAEDPRVSFFGNVNIGPTPAFPHTLQMDFDKLLPHYTHLLMASGCTIPKLHSALPPSDICRTALSLVHWYTDHPSLPSPPSLDKASHVTIVGHGNVSLDVARILLSDPARLSSYDVPKHVLQQLTHSNVQHVSIVGRRGPLEASFTTKELRELMTLPDTSMVPFDDSIPLKLEGISRKQARLLNLLRDGSQQQFGTTKKTFSIDFFRSPTGLAHNSGSSSARVSYAQTALDADKRAVPTGNTLSESTDLVVTSLGYRGEPFQAWYDPALGHIRNDGLHVIDNNGETLKNIYTSGWAATGARGVILSSLLNANMVADQMVSEYLCDKGGLLPSDKLAYKRVFNSDPHPEDPPSEIAEGLKDGKVIDFERWKFIDNEEVRRGKLVAKERERMRWEEVYTFLGGSPV